ncbi:hypothetical protein BTR23_13730 [Alkalihalophilus pseudofirmus]|nr:hypothetical protein BTR23_13730 [Alkalihalophilus pseudofirmus]
MKKVAYLGWLGHGNLGDDGCYILFRNLVNKYSSSIIVEPITVETISGNISTFKVPFFQKKGSKKIWPISNADYVVLGGGSLLNAPRYLEVLVRAHRKGIPTAICGTGIDGLSMENINAIRSGSTFRAPTRSPFDARYYSLLKQVVKNSTVIGVRGPHAYELIRETGCDMKHTIVSGDLGLVLDQLSSVTKDETKRLVVIWGESKAASFGKNQSLLITQMDDWLSSHHFKTRPLVCILWSKDRIPAQRFVKKMGGKVDYYDKPLSLDNYRKVLSSAWGVISYRLHGSVFSAACKVPFISLSYRSKCYDFADSISQPNWALDINQLSLTSDLDKWMHSVQGQPFAEDTVEFYKGHIHSIIKQIVASL